MAVINEETRDAWQFIANECSKVKPYPGRRVQCRGRKHRGVLGTVLRHQLSKYTGVAAFRYGGDASLHMRQMEGRYGYTVLVQPEDGGKAFWIDADSVVVEVGAS